MLTTGDIATRCGVSQESVKNWIENGEIKAFKTPGGHYRILIEDFDELRKKYNMPPFKEHLPNKQRILVVDDDPNVVNIIIDFLSRTTGYELASASDGFSAGRLITKFHPDLVILDLIMPYMDGFDVCRKIKSDSETLHIMVLVITGYPEKKEEALECGADDFLKKPFDDIYELKRKVDELFNNRRQRKMNFPQKKEAVSV